MGMMGSSGGNRATVTGFEKTTTNDLPAGTEIGRVSVRGLPAGGTWSIAANSDFDIDPVTGAITTKVDNITVNSYAFAVTYTVTAAPVTFTVSFDITIIVEAGAVVVVITGTPTIAKIGTAYSFSFTTTGATQITSGASDLADVGLTYNGATGALTGTP